MAQTSYALMTTLGRAKEAAALANGTPIQITHIAIGDGTTVPSGGETALYHEVARKAVTGYGTVAGAANVAYFDIYLAAAEGPYTIREAGLYDSAGDLIAIAWYDPPINKPIPSSGQTVEGTIRLEVAFSDVANITVVVDPSMQVPLQRLTRMPWIPIISMTVTAPPGGAVVGDTYLIPADASGAWTGQVGKIAEKVIAGWAIIPTPDGHAVSLPDGRVFIRLAGAYVELAATETFKGLVELATVAEALAGTGGQRAVTPAGLAAAIRGQPVVHWRASQSNTLLPHNVNTLVTGFSNITSNLGDTTYNAGVWTIGAQDAGRWIIWGAIQGFDNSRVGEAIMLNGAPSSVSDNSDAVNGNITAQNLNVVQLLAGTTVQLRLIQLNTSGQSRTTEGAMMAIRIGT